MNDTSPVITKKFYELMKKKSNEARFLMGCSMYDTAKEILRSSIYSQHPKISPIMIKKEFFLRFYGIEFSKAQKEKVLNALLHSKDTVRRNKNYDTHI